LLTFLLAIYVTGRILTPVIKTLKRNGGDKLLKEDPNGWPDLQLKYKYGLENGRKSGQINDDI
jgi:hypothetical protein